MSFSDYLKDKRYFILFYLVTMSFVSVMMIVTNKQQAYNNIIYTNICCLFFVILYLVIGYYYRRSFYSALQNTSGQKLEYITPMLPEAQTVQQQLYLNLIRKIEKDDMEKLQLLHEEKRDQQEFIMSWVHEVKLPIAASRLLLENSEGKAVENLIDKLEDELDKIESYVEQALYYSRIDSFSKDYFIQEIDVQKVIKNSIKKYAKLFINREISLGMNEEAFYVQSDSKWLGFAIDQIIANALKYSGTGGKITIGFSEDSKEKRLSIKDNGIGIKSEDLQRVFDKGFTGSIGRIHTKSTGMGLYLAKQLTVKLGHQISIQSEEGKYTMLTIHFGKRSSYLEL